MRDRYLESTSTRRLLAAGLVAFTFIVVPAWGQEQPSTSASKEQDKDKEDHRVVRTFGTEKGYRTELVSETAGRLTQEDQRQLSLLMIGVLEHIDKGRIALDADETKDALKEVNKGLEGTQAIRKMLPKTMLRTKTIAPDGKPIFEDELVDQNDSIPLYAGILHARTLTPIVEARRNALTVAGVQVVESERVITEAIAKLDPIEAQLTKAAKALGENKSDVATKALAMALVRGLDFRYTKEDSELISARDALWFAKRALEENNVPQAAANLNVAHQRMVLYREVLPNDQRRDVDEVLREVEQMQGQLRQERTQPTATATARGADRTRQGQTVTQWWDKVNTWFRRHL
jgi:hypothetical protein